MSTASADPLPEPPAFRRQRRPHEVARVLRRKRRPRATCDSARTKPAVACSGGSYVTSSPNGRDVH
jgi:hypothetical protein